MKKILVALMAATALLPATPGRAALPCNLVSDPAGDVTTVGGQKIDDGNVDIRSADLGVGVKQVVAVMRVAKLEAWDKLGGQQGNRTYTVFFTFDREKTRRYLEVYGFQMQTVSAPVMEYSYGHVDPTGAEVRDGYGTGSVNLAAGTVTAAAPVAAWKSAKLGTIVRTKYLSNVSALALTHFVPGDAFGPGQPTLLLNPARPVDTAKTTKKLLVGTKTCVPAP